MIEPAADLWKHYTQATNQTVFLKQVSASIEPLLYELLTARRQSCGTTVLGVPDVPTVPANLGIPSSCTEVLAFVEGRVRIRPATEIVVPPAFLAEIKESVLVNTAQTPSTQVIASKLVGRLIERERTYYSLLRSAAIKQGFDPRGVFIQKNGPCVLTQGATSLSSVSYTAKGGFLHLLLKCVVSEQVAMYIPCVPQEKV